MSSSDLTIKFANPKARKHFVDWLNGQGIDCCYEPWMDAREDEGREQSHPDCVGNITVLDFKTDNHKNPSVIETTLGRLDSQ